MVLFDLQCWNNNNKKEQICYHHLKQLGSQRSHTSLDLWLLLDIFIREHWGCTLTTEWSHVVANDCFNESCGIRTSSHDSLFPQNSGLMLDPCFLSLQNSDSYSKYKGKSETTVISKESFNIHKPVRLPNFPRKWKQLGLDRLPERGTFHNKP